MNDLKTALGAGRACGFRFVLLSVVALATTAASAQTFTTLYNFQGTDGSNPFGSIMLDAAGNLYGTTAYGGAYGYGTAFKLTPQGVETVLYSFAGEPWFLNGNLSEESDAGFPAGNLIADSAGNLYGTASWGLLDGAIGALFKLTAPAKGSTAWTETLLATGFSIGAGPNGPLIADAAGNLYGTTQNDVFEVTTAGVATVLYSFQGLSGDGYFSQAGLVADAAGNLYGTCFLGGAIGGGTVFKLMPPPAGSDAWSETILYSFTGNNDGAQPASSLIIDAAGNLYGTTSGGGAYGSGTVFQLTPSGTLNTLYSFAAGVSPWNGWTASASLIMDAAGNLYGTSPNGGPSGYGMVFELSPPSSGSTWTETVLHSFSPGYGIFPQGALIADSAGNLYGTTAGTNDPTSPVNFGSVFKIALSTTFNGIPGKPNCYGQSISFLAQEYGGIAHAATTLGYPSVAALESAVTAYCGGK